MNKNTFCVKPFSGIFLSPNGDIQYCCALKNKLGNLNESSIKDILSNEHSKDIRRKVLKGEWHDSCLYCKKVEDSGGRSERLSAMNNISDISKFDSVDEDSFFLEMVDLRWSNACNLSCNYCNSLFSSKWASILGNKVNNNNSLMELELINFISDNSDTLNTILLLGGEPLLQKQNEKLLDVCIDKNITILTNLSLDLEKNKIYKKLIKNPNVNWNISFETIGDKFEYVRHGAGWDRFNSNLKLLNSNGYTLSAHPVYCLYTAYNLIEYYDYILNTGYFNNIFWQMLNHPIVLDVGNHNNKVIEKSIIEIDRCIDTFGIEEIGINDLISIKKSLISKLDNQNNIKDTFLDFVDIQENKHLTDKKTNFYKLYNKLYSDIVNY